MVVSWADSKVVQWDGMDGLLVASMVAWRDDSRGELMDAWLVGRWDWWEWRWVALMASMVVNWVACGGCEVKGG